MYMAYLRLQDPCDYSVDHIFQLSNMVSVSLDEYSLPLHVAKKAMTPIKI